MIDKKRSRSKGMRLMDSGGRWRKCKSAITIRTSRIKSEKTDFVLVKTALQRGIDIDTIAVLQGVRIKCLRLLPGESINVVFATGAEVPIGRANVIHTIGAIHKKASCRLVD